MHAIQELLEDARLGKFNRNEIFALSDQQSNPLGMLTVPSEESVRAGCDDMGNTLLHYAAYWNNASIANDLVSLFASPHQPNNAGDTAFDIAEKRQAADVGEHITMMWNLLAQHPISTRGVVREEYKKGLGDPSGAHGAHLIHYAAMWSPEHELQKHLTWQRPLSAHFAASRVFEKEWEKLVAGHDLDTMQEAEEEQPDIVNLYATDDNGWTALHAAAAMPGRSQAVKLLATFYKEKAPEYLLMKTSKPYTVTYHYPQGEVEVSYPAQSTAQDLIDGRLAQDMHLSDEQRQDMLEAKEIIAKTRFNTRDTGKGSAYLR